MAVAEAEKIMEDPKYQYAHHMLRSYTDSALLNKSGKDLAHIVQLLRKHHELNTRLESFEDDRDRLFTEHDKILNERNDVDKELRSFFS